MSKFITAQVIKKDTFLFAEAPQTIALPCDEAKLIDIGWAKPLTNSGGVVVDYQKILIAPAKPSVDSIRIIIIEVGGSQYWVIAPDNATNLTFTNQCNACCGSTPSMPAVVIFPPVQQICPCLDADGTNRTFVWPMPFNPSTLRIAFTGTFDGAAIAPTPPASFANNAAVLAWLIANAAAYGTWTMPGGVLTLVSATVKCAGLVFTLVPATFCYTYDDGETTISADGITIGGNDVLFPGGAITFSNTDLSPLQFALSQLLVGTLTVQLGDPSKLTFTGYQVPTGLLYQGAAAAGNAFVAGACAWTFDFAIPVLGGGEHYEATNAVFNGVAATPTIVGVNHASAAALLVWVTANWGTAGTWSLQAGSTILRLVGTATYSATGLVITSNP
jgi:hypothetical protein